MAACITVNWDCNPEIRDSVDPEEVVKRERAELFAQTAIVVLTGRQVGNCPHHCAPVPFGLCPAHGVYAEPWMVPYIKDGTLVQLLWVQAQGLLVQEPRRHLPRGAYRGASLRSSSTAWRWTPRTTVWTTSNQLVRLGGAPWPKCQDMAAAHDSEVARCRSPTCGCGARRAGRVHRWAARQRVPGCLHDRRVLPACRHHFDGPPGRRRSRSALRCSLAGAQASTRWTCGWSRGTRTR